MKKWEYLVRILGCDVHVGVTEEQLNALGERGWELVSEVYFGDGNGTRYTFKRPATTRARRTR